MVELFQTNTMIFLRRVSFIYNHRGLSILIE